MIDTARLTKYKMLYICKNFYVPFWAYILMDLSDTARSAMAYGFLILGLAIILSGLWGRTVLEHLGWQ